MNKLIAVASVPGKRDLGPPSVEKALLFPSPGEMSLKGKADDASSAMSSVSIFSTASTRGIKPKLNFSSPGLFGRARETDLLLEAFENAQKSSRQVVFLGGEGGSGKSSLAHWLMSEVSPERAIFVSGKHTVAQKAEPYTAFSQICRQLCLDIAGSDDLSSANASCWSGDKDAGEWCTDGPRLAETIGQSLGSHAKVLLRVVPSLKLIVGDGAEVVATETQTTGLRMDERNQLHGAFRTFFRILADFKTLVLVLDDLQWADQASLDLFDYLARDGENSSLLMIGCFRSNEVGVQHPLMKMTVNLEVFSSEEDDRLVVSSLTVGNLDIAAVNEMIQIVLGAKCGGPDTLPLAEVIYSRTLGNAFFSLLFLKSLTEDNVIELDSSGRYFTWNLDQVKLTTTATRDAIELMQAKLDKLPTATKTLVRLASIFGTTVFSDLFDVVVNDYYANPCIYFGTEKSSNMNLKKNASGQEALNLMLKEGLMYRIGKKVYRWEHDKILEAAMLPKSSRAKVALRAGETLQSELEPSHLEHHLFSIVRLLNEGSVLIPTTNAEKRVNLAELNLMAGKKSIDNSGFDSALSFFTKGIQLLPSNHGRVYAELSVDLFSFAAESEYCTGNVSSMKRHCRDVISRPHIPLKDKRRAYSTLMDGLNGRGQCKEAVDLSIGLLAQLGCVVPKKCLVPRILSGIMHMKTIEKRGICAELDKVPPMADPEKLWAMDILADLFKYAYLADMPHLVAVVLFKSFQWNLKYGRSPKVSMSLAQVGMLAASIGEYRVSQAYVEQSLAELESHSTEKLVCDVYTHIFTLAWHWTNDVDTKMLTKGHSAGIAAGAAENARYVAGRR